MNVLEKLQLQNEIKTGLVGMGSMGFGLFYQMDKTPGIECLAIADINLELCIECAKRMRKPYRVVTNLKEMRIAIHEGYLAVCDNGNLVAKSELMNVFVEASTSIVDGYYYCETALEHGKDIVLMNSEIDLIYGPLLHRMAEHRNQVYTSCDGDQHGVLKRLINDLQLWDFELVMAGNIKGFLDRYSNPIKIIPEADKRNLGYKMATAYTDGTKLNIEMALVANNLGLRTLTPGMFGPQAANVHEALNLFDLDAVWKSNEKVPFVDYILGAEPGGGVFAIGYCKNTYQQEMMQYYKMGDGPYYLFYRPYHLCHVESMKCIAEAFLDRNSLLPPSWGFHTNVYAYAKRDIKQGEALDGIGGHMCYGQIENAPAIHDKGVPICVVEGSVANRKIKKDAKIVISDVSSVVRNETWQLYQEALATDLGK